MKTNELNLEKQGYNMSANIRAPKSHTGFTAKLGLLFPTTKAQAIKFSHFDVLNLDDCLLIDSLMNKHGVEADYKYTKSKYWVRLQNQQSFIFALKKEYNF